MQVSTFSFRADEVFTEQTRAMATNGRYSATARAKSPTTKCWSQALSTPRRTLSNTLIWWRNGWSGLPTSWVANG